MCTPRHDARTWSDFVERTNVLRVGTQVPRTLPRGGRRTAAAEAAHHGCGRPQNIPENQGWKVGERRKGGPSCSVGRSVGWLVATLAGWLFTVARSLEEWAAVQMVLHFARSRTHAARTHERTHARTHTRTHARTRTRTHAHARTHAHTQTLFHCRWFARPRDLPLPTHIPMSTYRYTYTYMYYSSTMRPIMNACTDDSYHLARYAWKTCSVNWSARQWCKRHGFRTRPSVAPPRRSTTRTTALTP